MRFHLARTGRTGGTLAVLMGVLFLGGDFCRGGETVDYQRQVKPILRERCYACHGALKRQGGLRLDTGAFLRRGGDTGPAVEPGNADESLLIDRVSDEDPRHRMPPEGPSLTPEQIVVLRDWIDQGADSPSDESPEEDPRRHWAFQPLVRPVVPAGGGTAWCRNPIDAFLVAGHEKLGVSPLPEAEPEVLLRRVHLDLVGLPPSRDLLREFAADPSDAAYRRIVDRLLESPHYGERWGRHWMDVWRYSDWYGRRAVPDVLNSYGMIWRWRDWIVRSLNEDRGYDWMILRMLAADELEPLDEANLVATGYVVRNFFRWNYNSWLKDNVEHTAKAFLGLTVQCAHCHDHKYDPISQEDYFALRACFEPIEIRHDRVPGEPDPGPYPKYDYGKAYPPITSGMVRVFDDRMDVPTYLYSRGESRNIVPNRPPIPPGVPRFLHAASFRVEPITLPAEAFYPGLKEFVRHEEIKNCKAEVQRREEALAEASKSEADPADREVAESELKHAHTRLESVRARIAADEVRYGKREGDLAALSRAAVLAECGERLAAAEVKRVRAERDLSVACKKGSSSEAAKAEIEKLERAVGVARSDVEKAREVLKHPPTDYTPLTQVFPSKSTGRRLALARWIVHADNPLTARVAVNHIWRWHFHQPLVATPHDFGRNGKRPTHPELLDWLASELIAGGWRMKAIHRLIVTSAAYRMRSHAALDHPNHHRDPENQSYWRFPPARMEAEVVRDSLLATLGILDPHMGGPDLDFTQGFTTTRRSIYLSHHGEGRMQFLELFDAPDVCEAYTRTESIIPQQSLALANNELARSHSRALAGRLWEEIHRSLEANQTSPAAGLKSEAPTVLFIRAAFEQILNRRPKPAEVERSIAFLQAQEELFGRSEPSAGSADEHALRARGNFVHVLLNHHDFLMIR